MVREDQSDGAREEPDDQSSVIRGLLGPSSGRLSSYRLHEVAEIARASSRSKIRCYYDVVSDDLRVINTIFVLLFFFFSVVFGKYQREKKWWK